jgi:hypothetical protein
MPARSPARRVFPGAAALVLSCAALAGCAASGGSSSNSASGGQSQNSASAPSGGSSSSAGNASANTGKLTGNFCTDFKNVGSNIPIPATTTGSLATLEQHDGRYLRQVAAYYGRLAAEAPPPAGKEIRLIASAYQQLAGSIASAGTSSISKIEQQITSLTTSGAAGNALKQLVVYVTTKCA